MIFILTFQVQGFTKLVHFHFPSGIMLSSPNKKKKNGLRLGTTTFLLIAWWFTSVTGTLINKKVMKRFPFPIAFTGLHLFIGALLDYLIISNKATTRDHDAPTKEPNKLSSNITYHLKRFRVCTLNGLLFSMAKYLTYLSYRQVPVSLTHTIKSMSPVFSVISQLIIFQHCVPLSELLTLIPIILGVTLSTINEIHFEMVGFLAAVCSTILGVAQNTTSKYILTHNKAHKNKLIISPMQLHMYGSLLSLVFLIPLSIYSEGHRIYNMQSSDIPLYYMMTSCCWLYGQTMASLFLLKRVTTVTHNVANTCKRFWIIVISIIYFNQETTVFNLCGIVLALSGFFLYQKYHKINNKKQLESKLKLNFIQIKHDTFKLKNGGIHHRKHEHDEEDEIELGQSIPLINSNVIHDHNQ
eukprot:30293_1